MDDILPMILSRTGSVTQILINAMLVGSPLSSLNTQSCFTEIFSLPGRFIPLVLVCDGLIELAPVPIIRTIILMSDSFVIAHSNSFHLYIVVRVQQYYPCQDIFPNIVSIKPS